MSSRRTPTIRRLWRLIVHVIAGRPQLACIELLIARLGSIAESGDACLDEFYLSFVSLVAPGLRFLTPRRFLSTQRRRVAKGLTMVTLLLCDSASLHLCVNEFLVGQSTRCVESTSSFSVRGHRVQHDQCFDRCTSFIHMIRLQANLIEPKRKADPSQTKRINSAFYCQHHSDGHQPAFGLRKECDWVSN